MYLFFCRLERNFKVWEHEPDDIQTNWRQTERFTIFTTTQQQSIMKHSDGNKQQFKQNTSDN